MNSDPQFLASFLDQDIYVIKETGPKTSSKSGDVKSDLPVESLVEEPKVEYSGSMESGVAVLVQSSVSKTEKELLSKIMGALNLGLDKVALLTADGSFAENPEVLNQLNYKTLISFGVTNSKSDVLNIQAKYAKTSIEDKTVIISDSLTDLGNDRNLKVKLWKVLQELI